MIHHKLWALNENVPFVFCLFVFVFHNFLVLRSVKRPFASAFPTHTLGQTYVDDHKKVKKVQGVFLLVPLGPKASRHERKVQFF